jgi:beta-glucosidase
LVRGAHHILLAHGKGVQVLRAKAKRPGQVGFAPAALVGMPVTEKPPDVDAARQAMFSATRPLPVLGLPSPHFFNNTWWLDPVFLGRYPEDGLKLLGPAAPQVGAKDLDTIRQPLDFFGANIYFGGFVRAGTDGQPQDVPYPPGIGINTFGFPVTPTALYWGPRFFWERYRKPIVITENGVCVSDWVALDGKIHDPQRVDFLSRYLLELRRAVREGVDVRGYFHWSLMDNFEWADGFRQRFGLVYVDFVTQKRTIKDSAHWYRGVTQSNGASLGKSGSA